MNVTRETLMPMTSIPDECHGRPDVRSRSRSKCMSRKCQHSIEHSTAEASEGSFAGDKSPALGGDVANDALGRVSEVGSELSVRTEPELGGERDGDDSRIVAGTRCRRTKMRRGNPGDGADGLIELVEPN